MNNMNSSYLLFKINYTLGKISIYQIPDLKLVLFLNQFLL